MKSSPPSWFFPWQMSVQLPPVAVFVNLITPFASGYGWTFGAKFTSRGLFRSPSL